MPMLDMSVEKLRVYRGITPCPEDFDAFWDDSLKEMRAIDAQVTFEEAAFHSPGVRCCDLWYTGAHGARIHANFACPEKKDGKKHPGLLLFHGYTGAAPNFLSMLPYAYAGFFVAAMDVRGQGGKSQDPGISLNPSVYGHIVRGILEDDPKKLFFRDVFLDAAQLAGILMDMEEVDEKRVACTGGSQGGGLSFACAALDERIALCVPKVPWLCDYKRTFEMDLDVNAYQGIRDYFRHFDPLHEKEDWFFTRLGYIDNQNLAHRIRAKVVMVTGLLDNICPPSTQFAAYNRIESEKEVWLMPDYKHEVNEEVNQRAHQLILKELL